jgi:hypothetical protein
MVLEPVCCPDCGGEDVSNNRLQIWQLMEVVFGIQHGC